MAQVISHYSATVGGNSTMYHYVKPDNTSSATRIYTGTVVTLPVDYEAQLTNKMYPTIDPGGWMYAVYFRDITPVYITVTDVCTPPSALTLDAAAKQLIITGGDGGDLNVWTGFGVSWRERRVSTATWGDWSPDTVVQSRTVSVSVSGGMVRQYRVRTMGAAGEAYYSAYAVCNTLLNGNTAAGMPVVLLPVSGTQTCAPAPVIKVDCPADADGDTMTLERSVDGGAWTFAASVAGTGGVVCDAVPLEPGEHTLRYRLLDTSGEGGAEDSVSFACITRTWRRPIAPGAVIANKEISFVSDVYEMLERLNLVRVFYGLAETALPGSVGAAADWGRQLGCMQNAIDECKAVSGREPAGFDPPEGWPNARQINLLRAAIQTT